MFHPDGDSIENFARVDGLDTRTWYYWRPLSAIPVRKPLRAKSGARTGTASRFTVDGRPESAKAVAHAKAASIVARGR